MRKLRAAVIGAGFVGRAHIEALRRLGMPVQGVLGSSTDRAQETARTLGLDGVYPSLEDLARDSSVDVVHICTPNHLHFQVAKTLLESGKHVMCEKPLAMDSKESAELVRAARKQNRVGAVTYNLRYYPLCQEAHAQLQSGAIGEPRLLHGSFLQDWLFYPTDWNWRLEPELGGRLRAVSDIGTHWLDLMMWVTGKRVTDVCADLATVIPMRKRPHGRVETFQQKKAGASDDVKITTDDYASILLHFEDSLRGVVTVSQVSAGRKARLWFEVDGSEGSLAWDSESPNTLWIGHRNEANRNMIKDPALMSPVARGFSAYPGGHTEGYPDTFVQLFKEFYGYISADDLSAPRPFPTFETGHEEMVLCDAIAASAQEQRWINVGNPKVSR
ncbi:MAG TPA: Gfo/Idh/MocA family oxidoreductase [Terriglobales bacterium]|nr:Gfo/Idh/MocA family oxidoreductase [Terriglobales bacterium]